VKILGLFPRLDQFGGIEAVGRLAVTAFPGMTALYADANTARGKLATAARAAGSGAGADAVLVWHVGLAKLLPLVGAGRARVFVFLHGIEVWRRLTRVERALLAGVRRILTNSDHTWRRFVEFNPEFASHPHSTVSLGLDLALPPASAHHEPAPPPAALIVGRMQRSEDYKGHRELIEAWPYVRERVPSAQLWIAGDGDLRTELERRAADLAPGAVRFYGRVSEQEKALLFRRCRCFAMPSRGEGFGLVYLEAMAAGKPCLVSRSDAGMEVVQPPVAGLAVDPAIVGQLADALTSLLTAGEEAWSPQARDLYQSRFTAVHFQKRLTRAVAEAL
jgi:glycosyltransferase involved in cell wall biosynthesis